MPCTRARRAVAHSCNENECQCVDALRALGCREQQLPWRTPFASLQVLLTVMGRRHHDVPSSCAAGQVHVTHWHDIAHIAHIGIVTSPRIISLPCIHKRQLTCYHAHCPVRNRTEIVRTRPRVPSLGTAAVLSCLSCLSWVQPEGFRGRA